MTKSFTNYEVQDGTAYNIVTKIPYTKIVDNYQIPKPDAIYFIKDLVIVTCLEAIMNNLVQRPDTTEGQTQILWSLSQKELAKRIGKLRGRIHSQLSDVSIGVY